MSYSGEYMPKRLSNFVDYLPVANQRHPNASTNFQSFCVRLHFLEGFNTKILKDTEYFHLEAILYDQVHRQFVGNKWQGATVTVKYEKVLLNQVLFFYTSISIREILLVVEAVARLKEWNCDKVIGWTVIPLDEVQELSISSQKYTQTRVPLYYGNPISLLFKNWAQERQNPLENASAGEIAYSLVSNPTLMRIVHLLPENIIVSNANDVPGLVPSSKGSDGLVKPQLQRSVTYILEQVTIKVMPALSSVEAEIINRILEERNSNDSLSPKFSEAVIVQRRLQVGVHNGLCYIQDPDFYHLLVEPVITASFSTAPHGEKMSSSTSSPSNFSRNECLTLRSDVKIPNVPYDPNVMLIFIVEYGISLKDSTTSSHQTSSLTKRPTSTMPVLWGLCQLDELRAKSQVSIHLTSDPTSCPSQTLFMKMSSSQKFELTFSASSMSKKKENASVTSLSYNAVKEGEHGSYTTTTIGEEITSVNTSPLHQEQQILPQRHTPPKKPPRSFFHLVAQNAVIQASPSYTASEVTTEYEEKNSALQEITVIPSSLPVIPVTIQSFSGEHNLPRMVYSKICSAGFPTIFDRNGQTPTPIDTSLPYSVDLNKELTHPPQGYEIVFEFLALSGMTHAQADIPRMVFFTCQFYRFPPIKTEKLIIEPSETDRSSPFSLHILHTLHEADKKRNQPGYMVSYHIDPCDLSAGEYGAFIKFLANSTIHVDMWDGNSLLYLGTASAPLKFFCRQGKEAVTVTLDLKVMSAEYLDDSVSQTASATHILTGNLHLRFTSIKVPLSPKSLSKLEDVKTMDSVIVYARSENNSDFNKTSSLITKAKPIVETSRELGALLSSRTLHDIGGHLQGSGLSEERRRKISRMEAVRSSNTQNKTTHSVAKDMRNLIRERQRDLMIVESYIERNKPDIIHSFLQKSITTEKMIHPTIGSSSFFEFELINPFPSEQNISISWQCPNLSLVTDVKEWQFLREVSHMDGNVEKNLITIGKEMAPTVYLESKEKVWIPFKYQCIPSGDINSEFWMASSGHNFTAGLMNSVPLPEHLRPSSVKVLFSSSEQTLTNVLVVTIQPVPPPVTKVFRLLAPEHSLFKKAIRLPCRTKPKHLKIKCTDTEVVCEVLGSSELPDHVDINLKAPTGSSGTCRSFYLFIYADVFCFKPSQILCLFVHSLQRIDLSCTVGQINRSSIVIKGDYATRLVQCFSSSMELGLYPSESFVLSACSLQELSVNIMPLVPGVRYFCLTMVDQEPQKLLKSWLLVVACPKPSISKAFQVHLTIGKEATKRITFINNFSRERQYVVHCSNPYLVHLKDQQFSVAGKESYALGIYFPPQHSYLSENVFIYINSSDDKNEETYCIKVACK